MIRRRQTRQEPLWWRAATRLTVFFLLALLAAQPRAQQMSLQEFGQARGLQNLAVTSLAQDSAGFIWAGTENGVYRFDGARFERIGAQEKLFAVNSLAVDGQRIWIAADSGLWLWRDERLQRVVTDGPPLDVNNYPQMIAPNGTGGAWVISNWHLLSLTPAPGGGWHRRDIPVEDEIAERPGSASITSVMAEGNGDAWFGCGRRICRLHAGEVDTWGQERGVPEDSWHWLLRSSDGSLWARGVRHVLQLEPGTEKFSDRTDARDVADPNGTYPLVEDSQHRILGAARNALERWNGHAWDRFGTGAGLPAGGRLQALLLDREGGIWLGMMGAGVLQWRGYGQWENWSVASGLPHTAVWRFARAGPPDHQVLYAATGAGVASLDVDAARFRPLADTADQETQALASDARGVLWAGTVHGHLLRFAVAGTEGERGTSIGLPGTESVYDIFAQRAGDVWINTDAGMRHRLPGVSSEMAVPIVTGVQGGNEGFSGNCEDRDGTMWFAGGGGVTRYSGGRWERLFRSTKAVTVLACLRDGTLAVSSGPEGVQILALAGSTLRDRDVTPPELRGRNILAMWEDVRGWLWVNTDAGIAVWNHEHWRLLDHSRGLVWNDTSAGALYEDHDGSMWIGTSRGASHILAPGNLFAPVAGRVAIRSVTWGNQTLPLDRAIEIPWSPDQLEIDLAMPVFRDRGSLAMEYRLRGFDDRWTLAAHPEVRLTGLPAGRYRFEARAIDRDLGTPSPGTGFDFEIDPPWWLSRIALAAIALATLAIAYGLYRWRVHVMTLRARQLETLVRERTRELEESRELLREQATKDGLTNVWNRRALMDILAREANRCAREQLPFAVALADIDHFKQVNDTYGHPAGDAVLREFAARLAAAIRPYDAVGRYGGEEFVVIMPGLDITQTEHRARLAAIHLSIAGSPMSVGTVTCSFGVAGTSGAAPVDVDSLIATADEALYRAKHNGRNRIEWSSCGALWERGAPPLEKHAPC
jgi:diguanylate cyclase (GGDEF)-like protein